MTDQTDFYTDAEAILAKQDRTFCRDLLMSVEVGLFGAR